MSDIRSLSQGLDKYGILTEASNIAVTICKGQQTLADPCMSQPNPLLFSQDRLPFQNQEEQH